MPGRSRPLGARAADIAVAWRPRYWIRRSIREDENVRARELVRRELGAAALDRQPLPRCHSYFFPKEAFACRNPACGSNEIEHVPLSATGTLWSYTDNHYQPPAPYMSPDPFVPYAIAAVELGDEKMVVLGQVASGVATGGLRVGMRMKLGETLYEDETTEYVVWKWAPAAA